MWQNRVCYDGEMAEQEKSLQHFRAFRAACFVAFCQHISFVSWMFCVWRLFVFYA
jgi:hypothetical protein